MYSKSRLNKTETNKTKQEGLWINKEFMNVKKQKNIHTNKKNRCIFMKKHLSGAPHQYCFFYQIQLILFEFQKANTASCLWCLNRNIRVILPTNWMHILKTYGSLCYCCLLLYSTFVVSTGRLSVVFAVHIRNYICAGEKIV